MNPSALRTALAIHADENGLNADQVEELVEHIYDELTEEVLVRRGE